MYNFVDKTSTVAGTKMNRRAMMAIQGFFGNTIVFNQDGSITETNADNQIKTTTFNADGSITEVFTADGLTITKNTIFNSDGSITEEII